MPNFSLDAATRKANLRLEIKARRAMLDESARARAAWLLCLALGEWLKGRPETRIAVYLARSFEISLDALARELIGDGKTVCAPRLDLPNARLEFYRLSDLEATARGPWGVREPVGDQKVQPELVFMPGLAFDRRGHRLGTGGGWYDRALSPGLLKFGVCFGEQIVPEVPTEAHDISVDWLASETELLRCHT